MTAPGTPPRSRRTTRAVLATAGVAALALAAWLILDRDVATRGDALGDALRGLMDGPAPDKALVARAIWHNYLETRSNAAMWSAVYWGFSFTAAVFSALAALVLKLETLVTREGAKKDVAAWLSVAAALLVTVSTSGDFQRKWQANRIAAAELERTGYAFVERDGADARSHLAAVGRSLMKRHMAILGSTPSEPTSAPAE